MAYKGKNVPTTRKSSGPKGSPSKTGQPKAGLKDPHIERLEDIEHVREEFMDGPDEPGENVNVRHKNRNLNKPDINKPAYN